MALELIELPVLAVVEVLACLRFFISAKLSLLCLRPAKPEDFFAGTAGAVAILDSSL